LPCEVCDRSVVHLDSLALEDHAQAAPVVANVGERAAHRRLARQPGTLFTDPGVELLDDRARTCLALLQALRRRLAADFLLDGIEVGDLLQQLVGNRRTFARCGLDHLSTGMAPAVSKHQRLTAAALWPGEAAVTAVAIDLQDAVKALEDLLAVDAAAPRRIVEHHAGRIGPAPRPIVAGQRPEIARLGAASSGIEHRCRRLV